MHPSEQYFWSELASLLRPVQHTFDALGQALATYDPVLLGAALVLVVLVGASLALLAGPEHETIPRTGWEAPKAAPDIELAAI